MALLFIDGFDHYATADITKKWDENNIASINAGGRITGSYVSVAASGGRYVGKVFTSSSTVIIGFALYVGVRATSLLRLYDGTTQQVELALTAAGALTISGQSSADNVVPTSAWTYVELKVTIDNTYGSVEVRINGSSTPVISASGLDTQATANAYVNRVRLISSTSGTQFYDDFYLCDTTGSTNNNFLGDVTIRNLYPNGAGNYTQFTPSTGSNYTCVDEASVNTTDYVSSSNVGDIDTYALGDLASTATGTIMGIQVNNMALKDDAGARSVANVIRSGTTDEVSSSAALSTSQLDYRSIHETDPATSAAWTVSGINALEAGTKVAA